MMRAKNVAQDKTSVHGSVRPALAHLRDHGESLSHVSLVGHHVDQIYHLVHRR